METELGNGWVALQVKKKKKRGVGGEPATNTCVCKLAIYLKLYKMTALR